MCNDYRKHSYIRNDIMKKQVEYNSSELESESSYIMIIVM